jgi:hypothetical protein
VRQQAPLGQHFPLLQHFALEPAKVLTDRTNKVIVLNKTVIFFIGISLRMTVTDTERPHTRTPAAYGKTEK